MRRRGLITPVIFCGTSLFCLEKEKEVQVKNKNFFMGSYEIFELGLKPKEIAVYCCLLRYCNQDGSCYPSRRLIAEKCSIDKKTVDSALKTLEELGLIKKVSQYRSDRTRTSNLYFVDKLLDSEKTLYG
jgi:predicted transcriptional regulator